MKRTSILAAAIGAAAVFGVGGTALAATTDDHGTDPAASPRATDDDFGLRGDGTVDDDATAAPVSPPASPSVTSRSGFGSAVSATQAEQTALRAAAGGRVVRVEAETEHGHEVWSVRVVVGGVRYDIDVDRSTGAIVARSSGRAGGDDVAADRHGDKAVSDDNARHAVEAGDDKGGNRAEAGDDKGGSGREAGDDNGGHGREAGDDSGRHGGDR